MTAALTPVPKIQFFADDGTPLVGGKLYSYAAGTTTPLATYTTYAGTVANTNPVILDSRGEADVWLDNALYKLALYDSDNALIWTVDNVSSVNSGIFTGPVSGTTGTFSGALTAASGTFSGAVSGTTGTFSGALTAASGTFSGNVSGVNGTFSGPVSGTTGTFSGNVQMASANGGSLGGLRNRLINGGFSVNQRGVSGTVTLAAGAYGHDRWKGGASGCTYTFATVDNVTTLTISAGSLIQVIEGINLETGTYCLSWNGTATAKIGAGSLSASGVTGSITGGTNTNIEISTGTVSKVQLELSPIPTTFESTRPYGMELALCQRYLPAYSYNMSGTSCYEPIGIGQFDSATALIAYCKFPVTTRVPPTGITASAAADFFVRYNNANNAVSAIVLAASSGINGALVNITTSGASLGTCGIFYTKNTVGSLLFTGCEL